MNKAATQAQKLGILAKPTVNIKERSFTVEVTFADIADLKKDQTELERIYEVLECETIDIVRTKAADIFIDDIGLFVEDNPIINLLLEDSHINLAGNILFAKGTDSQGFTEWFNENDIEQISKIKTALDSSTLAGLARG